MSKFERLALRALWYIVRVARSEHGTETHPYEVGTKLMDDIATELNQHVLGEHKDD